MGSLSKRILLVDDDDDLRATLADLLDDYGYQVQQARNAWEALGHVRQGPLPDAIIIDLMMPGMSGQRLREELATMDRVRDVPRLIFTAASERHIQEAQVAPDLVLRKPLSIPVLLEHLTALLQPSA